MRCKTVALFENSLITIIQGHFDSISASIISRVVRAIEIRL